MPKTFTKCLIIAVVKPGKETVAYAYVENLVHGLFYMYIVYVPIMKREPSVNL